MKVLISKSHPLSNRQLIPSAQGVLQGAADTG